MFSQPAKKEEYFRLWQKQEGRWWTNHKAIDLYAISKKMQGVLAAIIDSERVRSNQPNFLLWDFNGFVDKENAVVEFLT